MTRGDVGPSSRRLLELLAPCHDAALATARRLSRCNAEGDDLFQEATLRAWHRLGELRDESCFRAWFFAILLSAHRRRHRGDFWRRFLPIERAVERPVPPEADAIDGAQRMTRALATLSAREREAIVLFELEGFTLDEIAAVHGDSLSAVKSRLARARTRLRAHYEKDAAVFGRLATEKNA